MKKPRTKKERNAAKALARSKRNSPGGQLTKQEERENRQARTRARKRHQAISRTKSEMKRTTEAMQNMGKAAKETTKATKKLADQTQVLRAMEEANRSRLSLLTVPQLQDIARDHRIRRFTMMKKSELIDAICTFEMDRIERDTHNIKEA